MSEELRPCPFCGEMPVTENNLVACANKSCPTYDNYWTDPQILTIEQWNTRPVEDALNKRIADLDAENAELKERVAMLDVTAVYKSLGEMGYIEQVTNLKAENAALQSRIAELEAAQRWIPVSERLPEEGHKVLVLLTDGAISIDLIYGNDFLYENWVGDITHWMPLPKLPEVQE